MAVPDKRTKFREDVGRRLKLLRETLSLTQASMGAVMGSAHNMVSMIEGGERGLDPEDAIRLKNAKGVTLDWLYANDPSALPNHLFKPLMTPRAVPPVGAQETARAQRTRKRR